MKCKHLDHVRMVTCERNSGVTHCQGCGGEGIEMGFSLLLTDQRQVFEGLEHNSRLCEPTARFDIRSPQIVDLTTLI
jgi:hypothetical protein